MKILPRLTSVAASLGCAILICGTAVQAQTPSSGPTETGFVTLSASEVPVRINLTGRAIALNRTAIRPRVSGTIKAIAYAPGSQLEAGAPLFEIDPLTYEIAVTVEEAALARARADLGTAQQGFERAERLQGSATSRSAFEVAEAALLKAKASVAEAEANLRLARAQLDWTVVRSPISGIAGVAEVSIGDLVTANQSNSLTEVVQIDPIYIDVTEPYPLRQKIEAAAARGEVALSEPELVLTLGAGREMTTKAKLVTSSATVSTTTGTRSLRFEIANPEGLLAPGMFLHGALTLGTSEAVLVPQRAAQRERDGSLSAWIEEGGKAKKLTLVERGTYGANWVVISGIEAGAKLLIDGIRNLKDGTEVKLVPVEIDQQGVVRDANAAAVGN